MIGRKNGSLHVVLLYGKYILSIQGCNIPVSYTHLDVYKRQPAGAYCTATAAKEKRLNVDGKLTLLQGYTLQNVSEAIKTNIKNILQEKAFTVDYISYALIANTIFNTPGVIDYSNLTINSATANIPIGSREVATLGTVNLVE